MSLVKTVTETQRLPDSKYAKYPKVPNRVSWGVSMGWEKIKLELPYSAFKVSVMDANSFIVFTTDLCAINL